MSYAEPHDSGRRLTGLVVVVAFHVVLGYALVEGLARKIVEVVRAPLETKIVEEVKPPPPDKPPPPPKIGDTSLSPEKEQESYTSRLLKAKKKVWDERKE